MWENTNFYLSYAGMRKVIFLPWWQLWGQNIFAKVRDFQHLQIALYMRLYYYKQPLIHSILLYYYYTLILSYISVISLFVSFVFELGFIFPQSHDMCRICFNSYLNFCIQKSGISATKFPQSLIFSARIPRRYQDFSSVCTSWKVRTKIVIFEKTFGNIFNLY